eukprot:1065511-Prorocentrum_minimum.AAC.1
MEALFAKRLPRRRELLPAGAPNDGVPRPARRAAHVAVGGHPGSRPLADHAPRRRRRGTLTTPLKGGLRLGVALSGGGAEIRRRGAR